LFTSKAVSMQQKVRSSDMYFVHISAGVESMIKAAMQVFRRQE
jgi:hypothetical protein